MSGDRDGVNQRLLCPGGACTCLRKREFALNHRHISRSGWEERTGRCFTLMRGFVSMVFFGVHPQGGTAVFIF